MSQALPPFQLIGAQAQDLQPGRWLLEASAGTGKTYTIAGLVARLVVETPISLDAMAVMTFTRAATAELRHRIGACLSAVLAAAKGQEVADPLASWLGERARQGPGRERLSRALDALDGASISTIHGFCQRLIGRFSLSLGAPPDLQVMTDDEGWRREWCEDYLRRLPIAPDTKDWACLQTAPSLEQLERWALLLTRNPACLLPPCPPAPDIPAFFAALRAAEPRLQSGPLGGGKLGQQRQARALELLSGASPSESRLKALASIPEGLCKADPSLAELRRQAQALAQLAELQEAHFLHAFRQALGQRLRQGEGGVSHQDLLNGLHAGLHGPQGEALASAIAASYPVVLVDEFQDTDPIQWQILERCFGGPQQRLFLIGDPKQAIYRFRGADLETYLSARESVPPAQRFALDTNYRSDAPLLASLDALYAGHPQPLADPRLNRNPVRAHHPGRLWAAAGEAALPLRATILSTNDSDSNENSLAEDCARACAAEIAHTLQAGWRRGADFAQGQPLRPQDLAVLVPSHRYGALVHRALTALGIMAVCSHRASIFDTCEAAELRALMAAWIDPSHTPTLTSAVACRVAAGTAALSPDQQQQEDLLAHWSAIFHHCGERWRRRGFLAAFTALLDAEDGAGNDGRVRLAQLSGGERSLVNLLQLAELLNAAEGEQQLVPEGLLRWFDASRQGAGEQDAESLQPRLDRDADAVRISTIHVSKGLQYPLVFLPFAWSCRQWQGSKLPLQAGQRQWLLGSGLKSKDDGYYDDRLGEEARLLYVALTRAEHALHLFWASPHMPAMQANRPLALGSPLGWLLLSAGQPLSTLIADWKERIDELTRAGAEALQAAGIACQGPRSAPANSITAIAETPKALPLISGGANPRQRWPSSYSALIRGEPTAERDDDAHLPSLERSGRDDRGWPCGAGFGTALHLVLERALAKAVPSQDFATMAQRLLMEHGITASACELITPSLQALLQKPLPGGTIPLAELPLSHRRVELPFTLALHQSCPLGRLLSEHPLSAFPDYGRGLDRLSIPPGFLSGVIDLVAFDRGAWHIVDWKSNVLPLLGEGEDRQQQLRANMQSHHYPIQYHLYALALSRHLRQRGLDSLPQLHCHYYYARYESWLSLQPEASLLQRLDQLMADGGRSDA
ncbi:MAG: hypothetical protein EA402_08120 [Planctomycetota bacterium]|nr:MAG: hypothetical protein EA402_08120 [Planctomycetota bacterium]